MILRRPFHSPPLVLVVFALALGATAFLRGADTAGWAAVGTGGTAGYLFGTWLAIRFASGAAARNPRLAATLLFLALFLKAGPIVALAIAAKGATPTVREGLVIGAGLVYSVLVGRGLTPAPPRPTDAP